MAILHKSEDGAVILFLAILCVVLITFVSLAIDMYLFTAQQSKYEYTVKQAALASAKEYFRAVDEGKTSDEAETQARIVAETIAALNLNSHFTVKYNKDPDANRSDLSGSPGAGSLQVGEWKFSEARASTCNEGACFEERIDRINAARVQLRVPNASPLRTMFGGVFGGQLPAYTVTATAAAVPRRIVVLLDLSRSIIRDTHRSTEAKLPSEPYRLPASEFAFDLGGAPDGRFNCNAGTAVAPGNTAWMQFAEFMPSADAMVFENMFETAAEAGSLSSDAQAHFRDQYRCLDVPQVPGARFAVAALDDKPVPDPFNPGKYLPAPKRPEPLSSILEGINAGIIAIQNRGVPGDMIGLIGFDDEIIKAPDGNAYPIRRFPLTEVNRDTDNHDYRHLLWATNVNSFGFEQRSKYFLFPRYWGSKTFTRFNPQTGVWEDAHLPAMSDLNLALNEARDMLSEDTERFAYSENMVIAFTDGLHNCPATSLDTQFPCKDDEAYVQTALTQLQQTGGIKDLYLQDGIGLHVFLGTENSGPHIVLRKEGGSAGCMWPENIRHDPIWSQKMVAHYGGTMEEPPFYMPNYLYFPTMALGGTWSPLVEPCQEGLDLRSKFDQLCAAAQGGRGQIVAGNEFQRLINEDPRFYGMRPYTDNRGRLGCDYKGRSKKTQIWQLFYDIASTSPYILVE